jgi:Restriction endonuclease
MSDYDFSELNDKEFEILCAALIGDERGHRFERFKPGKDGGVDGRFFSTGAKEVVLQCKHQPRTRPGQLLTVLETVESKKVSKLNPDRYILAISTPLSRQDKKKLSAAFAPHIKRDDDRS